MEWVCGWGSGICLSLFIGKTSLTDTSFSVNWRKLKVNQWEVRSEKELKKKKKERTFQRLWLSLGKFLWYALIKSTSLPRPSYQKKKPARQHKQVLFSRDGTLQNVFVAYFSPLLHCWAKRLSPWITVAYQYTLNHVLTCQLAAGLGLADALVIQKWKVNVNAHVWHFLQENFKNKNASQRQGKKKIKFHFRSFMEWTKIEGAGWKQPQLQALNYNFKNERLLHQRFTLFFRGPYMLLYVHWNVLK